MTTIPLTDCCAMLGIDPKTLRHWLKRATMEFVPHPTDARLKCLSLEQVHQLATLHDRPLQQPAAGPAAQLEGGSVLVESTTPSPPDHVCPQMQGKALSTLSPAFPKEAELIKKLSCLETRVAQLSEHLTQLALVLLQERDCTVERRITALETVMQELVGRALCPPPLPDREEPLEGFERADAAPHTRPLHPGEQRARSRMPPLVEYSAQGTYVIISSLEGELHLEPDSPQWFDWLATLSSFRFVGKQGRFTAYRESDRRGPTRSWRAYRYIHHRNYKHSLGVTDRLTLACLEQAAATLQAHLASL